MAIFVKVIAIGMIGLGGLGIVMTSIGLYAFQKIQQEDGLRESEEQMVLEKARQLPGVFFGSLAALIAGVAILYIGG